MPCLIFRLTIICMSNSLKIFPYLTLNFPMAFLLHISVSASKRQCVGASYFTSHSYQASERDCVHFRNNYYLCYDRSIPVCSTCYDLHYRCSACQVLNLVPCLIKGTFIEEFIVHLIFYFFGFY